MTMKIVSTTADDELDDFWQGIADLAYLIDGEPIEAVHERLAHYVNASPAQEFSTPPGKPCKPEEFKRYAIQHMIQSFVGVIAKWEGP